MAACRIAAAFSFFLPIFWPKVPRQSYTIVAYPKFNIIFFIGELMGLFGFPGHLYMHFCRMAAFFTI